MLLGSRMQSITRLDFDWTKDPGGGSHEGVSYQRAQASLTVSRTLGTSLILVFSQPPEFAVKNSARKLT